MMKAVLTKKLHDNDIESTVDSAGIAEKDPTPASDNAKTVMEEMGLSLESHISKHVREVDLPSFDIILVVDQKTKDALIEQGVPVEKITILNEEYGGVPNPYGGDMLVYRECAQSIADLLEDVLKSL